jgi:molecular chaperone HscC
LPAAEIAERLRVLARLKIHPRDQIENRTVIARADRLFEESLGYVRDLIQIRTADFSDVLSRQDPTQVSRAREEFSRFLDSIERESPIDADSP